MRVLCLFLVLAIAGAAHLPPVRAQSAEAERGRSGLPIPRFVTLGAGEARMRAGPGRDYPVKWLFVRRTLPMEVIDEYGIYRKVRGPDGAEGWMDKALLSGARYALIVDKVATVRARPEADAPPVWRAEPGVIARVQLCAEGWCRIEAEGRSGYIRALDLWGVYPDEAID
ncbi:MULTISPECIES: SH3 domain-containing protein [Pacificimonas]|nr:MULTISPECIES: SH3 domain-containing protein [Pacificimonas]MBZ6377324.1 hypothetical protein [Pacificimonas aurantium]